MGHYSWDIGVDLCDIFCSIQVSIQDKDSSYGQLRRLILRSGARLC